MKSFIEDLSRTAVSVVLCRRSFDRDDYLFRDHLIWVRWAGQMKQSYYETMVRERDEGLADDEGLLKVWMRLVEPGQLFYYDPATERDPDFSDLRLALHPTIGHFATRWFGSETMEAWKRLMTAVVRGGLAGVEATLKNSCSKLVTDHHNFFTGKQAGRMLAVCPCVELYFDFLMCSLEEKDGIDFPVYNFSPHQELYQRMQERSFTGDCERFVINDRMMQKLQEELFGRQQGEQHARGRTMTICEGERLWVTVAHFVECSVLRYRPISPEASSAPGNSDYKRIRTIRAESFPKRGCAAPFARWITSARSDSNKHETTERIRLQEHDLAHCVLRALQAMHAPRNAEEEPRSEMADQAKNEMWNLLWTLIGNSDRQWKMASAALGFCHLHDVLGQMSDERKLANGDVAAIRLRMENLPLFSTSEDRRQWNQLVISALQELDKVDMGESYWVEHVILSTVLRDVIPYDPLIDDPLIDLLAATIVRHCAIELGSLGGAALLLVSRLVERWNVGVLQRLFERPSFSRTVLEVLKGQSYSSTRSWTYDFGEDSLKRLGSSVMSLFKHPSFGREEMKGELLVLARVVQESMESNLDRFQAIGGAWEVELAESYIQTAAEVAIRLRILGAEVSIHLLLFGGRKVIICRSVLLALLEYLRDPTIVTISLEILQRIHSFLIASGCPVLLDRFQYSDPTFVDVLDRLWNEVLDYCEDRMEDLELEQSASSSKGEAGEDSDHNNRLQEKVTTEPRYLPALTKTGQDSRFKFESLEVGLRDYVNASASWKGSLKTSGHARANLYMEAVECHLVEKEFAWTMMSALRDQGGSIESPKDTLEEQDANVEERADATRSYIAMDREDLQSIVREARARASSAMNFFPSEPLIYFDRSEWIRYMQPQCAYRPTGDVRVDRRVLSNWRSSPQQRWRNTILLASRLDVRYPNKVISVIEKDPLHEWWPCFFLPTTSPRDWGSYFECSLVSVPSDLPWQLSLGFAERDHPEDEHVGSLASGTLGARGGQGRTRFSVGYHSDGSVRVSTIGEILPTYMEGVPTHRASFTKGDTIGAGIDIFTGTPFFTKNGHLIYPINVGTATVADIKKHHQRSDRPKFQFKIDHYQLLHPIVALEGPIEVFISGFDPAAEKTPHWYYNLPRLWCEPYSQDGTQKRPKAGIPEPTRLNVNGPSLHGFSVPNESVYRHVVENRSRIVSADNVLPAELTLMLRNGMDTLKRSYSPAIQTALMERQGSNGKIFDVLDPTLYPFIWGVSLSTYSARVQEIWRTNAARRYRAEQSPYQLLPTIFGVSSEGEIDIRSELNTLHRESHREIYDAAGGIFSILLPLFEHVCEQTLQERELQVIVRSTDYCLKPGEEVESQPWCYEGAPHEDIVAVALCFYHMDRDVVADGLAFRQAEPESHVFPQYSDDDTERKPVMDIVFPYQKSVGSKELGYLDIEDGRVVVFKNNIQSRMLWVETAALDLAKNDEEKAATLRVLTYLLVCPKHAIISTREIPNQQTEVTTFETMVALEEAALRLPGKHQLSVGLLMKICSFLPKGLSLEKALEHRHRLRLERETLRLDDNYLAEMKPVEWLRIREKMRNAGDVQ